MWNQYGGNNHGNFRSSFTGKETNWTTGVLNETDYGNDWDDDSMIFCNNMLLVDACSRNFDGKLFAINPNDGSVVNSNFRIHSPDTNMYYGMSSLDINGEEHVVSFYYSNLSIASVPDFNVIWSMDMDYEFPSHDTYYAGIATLKDIVIFQLHAKWSYTAKYLVGLKNKEGIIWKQTISENSRRIFFDDDSGDLLAVNSTNQGYFLVRIDVLTGKIRSKLLLQGNMYSDNIVLSEDKIFFENGDGLVVSYYKNMSQWLLWSFDAKKLIKSYEHFRSKNLILSDNEKLIYTVSLFKQGYGTDSDIVLFALDSESGELVYEFHITEGECNLQGMDYSIGRVVMFPDGRLAFGCSEKILILEKDLSSMVNITIPETLQFNGMMVADSSNCLYFCTNYPDISGMSVQKFCVENKLL